MASATKRARRERKLPKQQLAILAVCRFAEPIATTSLFPYLPEMIRSFGVPQNDVGEWAGTCAAAFSLSQALFGVAWGRFSDVHGRKPAILLGLTATMITSLVWGFSTNLAVAITARVLAGAGNGNVGIIRTTVAEMVPFKELQPRAFSLMPLVWNIGSIFGPTIGGALANPLNVQPGQDRSGGSLFERFPYALPNIVSAIFFSIGITTGLLYLEETLETKQGHRDYGLMLGRKLNASVQKCVAQIRKILRLRGQSSKAEQAETEPLIKPAGPDEERALPSAASETPRAPPPSWRQVLNYQAKMNLVTYTLLAGHTMAFDQLLPVFMQYPPLAPEFHQTNPIQFAGGFGLDHFTIGILSTCYGIFGMLVQFFLFPQIARRYGILGCLKWCVWIMPLCYLATPFTALLPTQKTQVAACFAIMLVKCLCGIFAFPCSTILLTNSASSLQVLGTLNGFATSCSAIGRALGPLLAGRVFSMGVKRGYIIAPWWLLAAVGFINILPVFYLVEGEGFGGDTNDEGEISDDDDDSETEDALHAQALEGGAEAAGGKPGPVFAPSTYTGDEEEEEGYGGVGPLLSRTTTRSSFGAVPAAEPNNGAAYMSPVRSRRGSRSEQGGRRVTRRVSIPLGLGGQGISRRYSSNLGQSLGSAGSFHE